MALTKHQKYHLDAMTAEIADNKLQSVETKAKLSASKNVAIGNYTAYLDAVKVEIQKILDSGIFPAGLAPWGIHDYLEK